MPLLVKKTLMLYCDYVWDLNPDQLILDKELNIDRLGWRDGDIFKLVNVDGRAMLRKVDPMITFLEGRKINE